MTSRLKLKDMNNKNPKWRQELNDIADEVARLQDRVHHAVGDTEPISAKPRADQAARHNNVILAPYDHTQGAPQDADVAKRRDQVRDMMRHAWRGYKERAWTENEVRPISGRGHSANIFGNGKTGATIVDALDTLWIMGLTDEFNEAKKWVEEKFVFNSNADVSVFETVIRFVGGFISGTGAHNADYQLLRTRQ